MRDVANIERTDRDGANFDVRRQRLSNTFSRLQSCVDRTHRSDRVRSWINIRYPFIDYLPAAASVNYWVSSEGQEDRWSSHKQTRYISGLVRVNDEIRPGRLTVLRFLYQAAPMEGIPRVHPMPFRRPLRNRDPELQVAVNARFFVRSKSLRARRRVLVLVNQFSLRSEKAISTDESKAMASSVALFNQLKVLCCQSEWLGLPLVFKSSFDKANRTSLKSYRGPGLEQGLKILEKVKVAYDLPIVTDVHESIQCELVGRVADIIQIPAFLCRQTDLLVAAAKTGKIINIKKGQFCAPSVMVNSAEKVRLAGNPNVMVCERGTMFGYNDLIVDPRNLEWMREANCPVVADVTHSLQQPAGKKLEGGGVASGGLRELIPCIARTAVAVGVDGIFMEVHDDPLGAPVDGPTQWPLRNLEELLEELIAIARVTKGKKAFKIDLTPFRD
ncbi:2-dehydro-3-deoxyphosphooctonate aldolase [Musa troglodytarum]|uniref:3-deoxy-8-phosphooctulonate synthase n=1 Tax=Musa troglodytarum TaxID=320322 RepID=A0A9E7HK20_9LILI|nr:2-dehydro-3-deoxyphosphooctonate aldolase [Musa troglodytarum]